MVLRTSYLLAYSLLLRYGTGCSGTGGVSVIDPVWDFTAFDAYNPGGIASHHIASGLLGGVACWPDTLPRSSLGYWQRCFRHRWEHSIGVGKTAQAHSGVSVFGDVGERTREGNDLYTEMVDSKVILPDNLDELHVALSN